MCAAYFGSLQIERVLRCLAHATYWVACWVSAQWKLYGPSAASLAVTAFVCYCKVCCLVAFAFGLTLEPALKFQDSWQIASFVCFSDSVFTRRFVRWPDLAAKRKLCCFAAVSRSAYCLLGYFSLLCRCLQHLGLGVTSCYDFSLWTWLQVLLLRVVVKESGRLVFTISFLTQVVVWT